MSRMSDPSGATDRATLISIFDILLGALPDNFELMAYN